MRRALRLATLAWPLTPAATALAIQKPAPGAAPEVARSAGLRPDVLAISGLLVVIAVVAVVLWYRSARKR